MLATRCGETTMLELLLEESAPNLELADKAGDTVLHYSCSKGGTWVHRGISYV